MGAIASQFTSLTIVYSTVYSYAENRKHQRSASLAFVRGIQRWPVIPSHKWQVTRKMFPRKKNTERGLITSTSTCSTHVGRHHRWKWNLLRTWCKSWGSCRPGTETTYNWLKHGTHGHITGPDFLFEIIMVLSRDRISYLKLLNFLWTEEYSCIMITPVCGILTWFLQRSVVCTRQPFIDSYQHKLDASSADTTTLDLWLKQIVLWRQLRYFEVKELAILAKLSKWPPISWVTGQHIQGWFKWHLRIVKSPNNGESWTPEYKLKVAMIILYCIMMMQILKSHSR